jgi:hypothetical protein
MHALTNQERQSAEIGFRAMETAASVMQRFAQPATPVSPPQPSETDQLMKMLMLKMMEKLIDRFDQPAAAVVASGIPGVPADMIGQLFSSIIQRGLNPQPSGPPVSASAELVRTLPQVAMTAVEGLREWRAGMEAQRDTVAIARGAAAVPPPPQGARPALPPQQAPAPNPAPNGATTVQPPSLEFLETKIMEFWREPISTTEAAEKTLDFLTLTAPEALDQLANLGETGLTQLFGTRQILKPATQNMPRLLEFVRALLKMHAEDKAESERKPN